LKVLIIDNYDSFTYNLAHYASIFVDRLDVLRSNLLDIKAISYYDKIILSPGPGLPVEHPFLMEVIDKYHSKKPILGICLGHQAIAQYFKAKLENLSIVKHGVSSLIYNRKNCYVFNNLPENFNVGHYHSWIVSKEKMPDSLHITSTNSEGIITSFTHKKFDLKGIQFHPESILTDYGKLMMKNWIEH
tara:strand:+ start:1981 stop:2544 length:564 start_codon:yes stop_codon:yes gene_type:complete